jgi:hypothetical protein
VYVGVEDDDPLDEALRLHRAGGDGAVVEHAVAFAPVSKGVMGAAGQVRRESLLQRCEAGPQSPTRGPPRALDHPLGPREADAPHLFLRERTVHDAPQIAFFVAAQDLRIRDRARHTHLPRSADASSGDPLAQHRVLDHREAVPLRQREHEVVAVEDLHVVASRGIIGQE